MSNNDLHQQIKAAAELPPPTPEETKPATTEEEQPVPVCQEGLEFSEALGFCVPTKCPEGQALSEETGLRVLEEQEPVEESREPRSDDDSEQEDIDSNN